MLISRCSVLVAFLGIGTLVPSLRAVDVAVSQPAPPSPTTYCNPLPIPDYPVGRNCRDVRLGEVLKQTGLWFSERAEQYRELADPCALYFEGKWYLYPSVDMAWVSTDNGATWQHHPLNIRDVGYAPTVVRHKGKFLLTASDAAVYQSDSPLGPFKELGKIPIPKGAPGPTDPMLFSDEDGRLYYFWGCTPNRGIWGVELDADDPTRMKGKAAEVIPFAAASKPWQRTGHFNENPNSAWIEGSWMLKHGNTYYLTYSASGTGNHHYAMGCSTSKSPLGPFVPQQHDPILHTPYGLVTGTGHGCIVEGPFGKLWAFYTLRVCAVHEFERRLGMDPAYIDEQGELRVEEASSMPRFVPTATQEAKLAGWVPVTVNRRAVGSSSAPNLAGRMAVDEDLRTWWQPAADDKAPMLTVTLPMAAKIHAFRIAWRDVGLDTKRGIGAGPFRYKVEALTGKDQWTLLADRSQSDEDLVVDYRECPPAVATAIRLVIVGAPAGITAGVEEFTAFGNITPQSNN